MALYCTCDSSLGVIRQCYSRKTNLFTSFSFLYTSASKVATDDLSYIWVSSSVCWFPFSQSCVCLVWTGMTSSLMGSLMDVPGAGASTDRTPSPDSDELMCCRSTPCGSLKAMKGTFIMFMLLLTGKHFLSITKLIISAGCFIYLCLSWPLVCQKFPHLLLLTQNTAVIFKSSSLVFPGEAPWHQAMLILPFLMISL